MSARQGGDGGMSKKWRVGAQGPKALIGDLPVTAKRAYLSIVPRLRMEPVLHDGRLHASALIELRKVCEAIAVADTELTDQTRLREGFECTPYREGLRRRRQGRVQNQTVQIVGPEVLQRNLEGLEHLLR